MIEQEVDLRPTFRSWARRWWLIVLVAGIFTGLAWVATYLLPARWGATATLLFPIQPDFTSSGGLAAIVTGQSSADPLKVYGGILQSAKSQDMIAKQINLPRDTVKKAIEVQTDDVTNQIVIKTSNRD